MWEQAWYKEWEIFKLFHAQVCDCDYICTNIDYAQNLQSKFSKCAEMRRNMKNMHKSPWMLHYDGSSCNGCDIEVLACTTPVYDVERFGVVNTGNPMHADIFLITGGINSQNEAVVKQIYSQMPDPKVVVAVGTCACTGGIFKECYNIKGGVDTTIPVDIYVPGCAARPESIIDGVIKAVALFQKKHEDYIAHKKEKRN